MFEISRVRWGGLIAAVLLAVPAQAQMAELTPLGQKIVALQQRVAQQEADYASGCAQMIILVAQVKKEYDLMDQAARTAIKGQLDAERDICTPPALAYIQGLLSLSEAFLALNEALFRVMPQTEDAAARQAMVEMVLRNSDAIDANSAQMDQVSAAIQVPNYVFQ